MSSASLVQVSRLSAVIASTILAIGLGGCIRPLYSSATTSTDGSSVRAALASIDVPEIPDRMGHTMRNELVFLFEGRDGQAQKRYRLLVTTNERVAATVVNSQFQRADIGTVNASANYRLLSMAEPPTLVARGSVTGFASFENTTQRFANLRAIREAQHRLAKSLAEQIHLQLATKLTSPGS